MNHVMIEHTFFFPKLESELSQSRRNRNFQLGGFLLLQQVSLLMRFDYDEKIHSLGVIRYQTKTYNNSSSIMIVIIQRYCIYSWEINALTDKDLISLGKMHFDCTSLHFVACNIQLKSSVMNLRKRAVELPTF